MAVKIGSNIASLVAQRRLAQSSDALNATQERLASGQRINRASDDAAGLSVALSLNATTRIFSKALRNVSDGVSALNITDGAMGELSKVVIRIKELAEQSANGSYSDTQRTAIDTEAQSLRDEFNRVVDTTSFNGIKLLNRSVNPLVLQVGETSSSTLSLAIPQLVDNSVGSGTFTLGASTASYGYDASVIADLNGDGVPDVAGVDHASGSLLITTGTSQGVYTTTFLSSALSLTNVNAADFNNDGKNDVVARTSTGALAVFLGNGDGTFNAPTSFSSGVNSYIFIGDTNGDGKKDLVLNDGSASVRVYLGNGNGTFLNYTTFATTAVETNITLSDLNGDGALEIIAGNGSNVDILVGNGNGTFHAPITYAAHDSALHYLADFNGDGKTDIFAVGGAGSGSPEILFGNGDGTFTSRFTISAISWPGTGGFTVGDFDGDGNADVAQQFYGASGYFNLFLNDGGGSFSTSTSYASPAFDAAIYAADINNDGATDILTVPLGTNGIDAYLNNTVSSPYLPTFSLATQSDARAALTTMQNQLDQLSLARGVIGSYESRLQVVTGVLQNLRENNKAAESRIMDVDIAQESSTLVRTQILQQAGVAVLAQANLQPQLALQLLRS